MHPPDWGAKPCFYSKKEAQTPRGWICQVWDGFGGWHNGGRRFEFMGRKSTTYIEVSHLVWESFISSNHFIQVENHPPWVHSPPFCGSDLDSLLWWLNMLTYPHKCPIKYPQQLSHLRDKSHTRCLWFRDWIFSSFPIYLTLWAILERKSK